MASFEGKSFDNGEFRGEINIEGVTEAGKQKDNTLLGDRVKLDQDKNSDSINNTDFSLILDSLKKMFDMSALIDAFQETGDVLSNFAEGSSLGELLERVGLGAKSKKNGENVNNRNKSAFKKLDPGNAAGFILIYNKLEDIYELLATGKGDKKKKNDGGGLGKIGNFFKGLAGLGANLLAICAAFLVFVGAIALAQKMGVHIGYALTLAGGFLVFTVIMVKIADQVKKDEGKLKDFAKSIALISFAILLFAVALALGAWVVEHHALGAIGFTIFALVFISSLDAVGEAAKGAEDAIIALGVFALLLSLSLILFGFALGIIRDNISWEGIGGAIIFFIAIGALAAIILGAQPLIAGAMPGAVAMGIFAVCLSAGLLLFAIALKEMEEVDWELAAQNILAFMAFIGVFALLGVALLAAGVLMVAAAAGAVLMTASLAVLTVMFGAMIVLTKILNFITQYIEDIKIDAIKDFIGNSLLSLCLTLTFAAVGLIAFALFAPIILAKLGILAACTLAILVTAVALNEIANQLKTLGAKDAVEKGMDDLVTIAQTVIKKANGIKLGLGIFLWPKLNAIKEAVDIIADVASVMNSVINSPRSQSELTAIMAGINTCFTTLVDIVERIVALAKNMDRSTRKNLEYISESLKPVIDAVSAMPNLVKELANMSIKAEDSPKILNNIDLCTETLNKIIEKIVEKIKGSAKKAAKIVGEYIKPFADDFKGILQSFTDIANMVNGEGENKFKSPDSTKVDAVMNSLNESINAITRYDFKTKSKQVKKAAENIGDLRDAFNDIGKEFSKMKPMSLNQEALSSIENTLKPFFDKIPTVQTSAVEDFTKALEILSEANFKKFNKNIENLSNGFEGLTAPIDNINKLAVAINNLNESIDSFVRKDFAASLQNMTLSLKDASKSMSLAQKANVKMMAQNFSNKAAVQKEEIKESDVNNEAMAQQSLISMGKIINKWDTDGVPLGQTFEQRRKQAEEKAYQDRLARGEVPWYERGAHAVGGAINTVVSAVTGN